MKFAALALGVLFALVMGITLNPGATGVSLAALAPTKVVERAAQPANTDLVEAARIDAAEAAPDPLDIAGARSAWRAWMARHEVYAGSMALGMHGQIVTTVDANRRADAPYPVASLSKAVTAMCLNQVLEETPFSWSSTLGDLTPALAAMNLPPHKGVRDIELRQLANHTSGFPKNFASPESAKEGRNLFTQQHFAREALTNSDRKRREARYSYSNVNYAVLGQVITAITGTPYQDACIAQVMDPASASDAVVGGRMWATGGFGGWSASAESYARFLMHWYAPDRPWVHTPEAYVFHKRGGAGLGVFHSIRDDKYLLTHNGIWRSKKADRQHGAFFAVSETGATFVANWQGNLGDDAYADLRKSVVPHLR